MMSRGDKEALLARLRRDARVIADHFGLEYASITSERANVRARYGACYSDGRIKIRLWNLRTGGPLRYSSLIDTLCHELAHLRHFDHGPQFKRLYQRILGWAKEHGIYRPQRGRMQVSGRPRGAAVRVPERNGVKVFVEPPRAADERPPWERWAEALGLPPLPPPRPRAPPKPRTPSVILEPTPSPPQPPKQAASAALPGQLSLLPVDTATPARRRERRPRRPRFVARQLSLFEAPLGASTSG